jgi:hypothetical protein
MTPSERLNKAYQDIQNLQIQPTRTNIMLLAEALLMLEEANKEISEQKAEKPAEEPKEEAEE